jgi:hypothetical protein
LFGWRYGTTYQHFREVQKEEVRVFGKHARGPRGVVGASEIVRGPKPRVDTCQNEMDREQIPRPQRSTLRAERSLRSDFGLRRRAAQVNDCHLSLRRTAWTAEGNSKKSISRNTERT